ncbi:MAG: hypothetical protein ACJA16_000374 [Akkermansiaceae bacterium]|jgi:hypothetical protein
MSLTRRSFVKKSSYSVAAVTILGTGLGLAAGASSQIQKWEYLLECTRNPETDDDYNPTYVGALDAGYAQWSVSNIKKWDPGFTSGHDNAAGVTLLGTGPVQGTRSLAFEFKAKIKAWQDDDYNDGNSGDDNLGEDIVCEFDDDITDGEMSVRANADETDAIVEWEPGSIAPFNDPLTIQNTNGQDDGNVKNLTVAGVIYPATLMHAAIHLTDSGGSASLGISLNVAEVGGAGVTISITKPATDDVVEVHLVWDFMVFRRPKGTTNNDDWKKYKKPMELMQGLS